MNTCIEVLYKSLLDKSQQVFTLFVDFFGEERVDLQTSVDIDSFKVFISAYLNEIDSSKDVDSMTIEDYIYLDWICNEERNGIYEIKETLCTNLNLPLVQILVHYPSLTITNEYDASHLIRDLYVKISLDYCGLGGAFSVNRSTYTTVEFKEHYLHSHVPRLDKRFMHVFKPPCLGTGPIIRTISLLNAHFDTDLWQLYLVELDNYIHTESIKGVPYVRIQYLTNNYQIKNYLSSNYDPLVASESFYANSQLHALLIDFQTHLINLKKIKFNYLNNSYGIAMSMEEFTFFVSNEFIKWYNEKKSNPDTTSLYPDLLYLKNHGIISRSMMEDGKVVFIKESINPTDISKIGEPLFIFKGNQIRLNIIAEESDEHDNTFYLLTSPVIQWVLRNILIIINQNVETRIRENSRETIGANKRIRVI